MRQFKNLCVALTVILGVALGISLVIVSRQSRRLAGCEGQHARDLKSISRLQEALRRERLQSAAANASHRTSEAALQADLGQREAAAKDFQRRLNNELARASDLEARLSDSSRQYQRQLAEANAQRLQEERAAETRLSSLKQQLKAAQAEVQASRLRVKAVETLNAKLRQEKAAGSAQTEEFKRTLAMLLALNSRRDRYVTSAMSRYRDITGQLDAMRGELGATRDSNANYFSSEALSRIQATLSLVNNDLRELDNLNGQIRKLEQKLAAK